MECPRCHNTETPAKNLFCSECGKLLEHGSLATVRMAGFVGVMHSTSDTIAKFWATGDPEVFSTPKTAA